jgi:hypothetical protein
MHAALEAVFERPFAAPARVDLRFHDDLARDSLGDFDRFILGCSDTSTRRGDAKFLKQLASLVFVDVHYGEETKGR